MKLRSLLAAVLGVALPAALLLGGGCSSGGAPSNASVPGSYSLVQTGTYLFVTASDLDALRVLDVAPDRDLSDVPVYVRAPSHLKALAIPVLPRPTALAQDHLLAQGLKWQAGDWVFATSAGSAAISIVSAQPLVLREVKRLPVAAPVTAVTAFTTSGDPAQTLLYFATFDGDTGVLYEVKLPATVDGLAAVDDAALARLPVPLVTRPGESISALLAVPPLAGRTADGAPFCASGGPCVVVATRRSQGASGDTVLFDPSTLLATPLAFPGPVRLLTTHGRVTVPVDLEQPASVELGVGERVFGLLDEEACGSPACGGALAISTRTATSPAGFPVANDIHGLPMLPIRPAAGLAQGLALGLDTKVTVPSTKSLDGGVAPGELDVAGLLTASNGELLFFDAAELRHMDWSADVTRVTAWDLRDPTGAELPRVQGPKLEHETTDGLVSDVVLADGAMEAQTLVITWRGPVPGVSQVPSTDADGVTLPVPAAGSGRVLVGDTVTLKTSAGATCEAQVVAVSATELTIDAVPAACQANRASFTARAGPDDAYIVQSTTRGYLGRAPRGGSLEYRVAVPLYRPDGFVAGAPSLRLDFLAESPAIPNGSFWSVDLASGFLPYSSVLDNDSNSLGFPGCFGQLPGPVVWDEVRLRIYGAFPSANGIIELDPQQSYRGVLGLGNGVRCYR